MSKAAIAALAAALLSACATTTPAPGPDASAAIAASVANPARPAGDIERDPARKPAQIVEFAGVKPGDTIAEIAPGGGYYTRILAGAVGPSGKVYALVPKYFADRPGGLDGINAIAEQYGNVEVVVIDYASTVLPEKVDLVWTTENYHDLVNGGIDPINAWVVNALKPGGIFFVEDHAAPGTGLTATSTTHRIDPEAVKQLVTGAGLVLEAESDVLHNPNDPHNISPREVDGVSDKFALRFRKPG